MKTYTKQVTKTGNCLEIRCDSDNESPRHWSNLGYFITVDRNYHSPDSNKELESIIKNSGDVVESLEEHIAQIKIDYEANNEDKVITIYPICKYEHSGVSYSLGSKHGFDYSNNGFYIVTKKTQKEVGTNKKDFERVIKHEFETYNKWCNGEVYSFVLYDSNGELIDSCSGFYDIEDIRDYLPKEYKKEELSDYYCE